MFSIRVLCLLVLSSFVCFSCAANVPTHEMTSISESEDSETTSIVGVLSDSLEKFDEIKDVGSWKKKPLEITATIYDVLAVSEDVAQEIFDCLEFKDYAKLRFVSKHFREFHDDCLIRIPCNIFPGFPNFLFDYYYAQETLVAHLKYRFAPIVKMLTDVKPQIQGNSDNEPIKLYSRKVALKINEFYVSYDEDGGLKLANDLLKRNSLSLKEIYNLLFSGNSLRISRACSLGLTTLVRELSVHYVNDFIKAIGPTGEGLLVSIKAKQYEISRSIIDFIRSHSHEIKNTSKIYINLVVVELINANYWDLFFEYYELNQENIPLKDRLNEIAEKGNIEGLIIVRNLPIARSCIPGMVSKAASKGHLEFLQEIDSMGLIQESCYTAIHESASHGQTDCLEFLVSRLGTQYLGHENNLGFLPIYLAAKCENTDTLLAIISLYPSYEPLNLVSPPLLVFSPLHAAVCAGMLENAKVLLKYFPKLINFKNGYKNTVIHSAMEYKDIKMLEYLLKIAPQEIVTARNRDGDTALHLGQSYRSCFEKHALLMSTNLFTGWERNNAGKTSIGVYRRNNDTAHPVTRSKLMEIFKLNTEEEYKEALRTVTNTTI